MKLLEEKNISLNQTFKTPQEAIIYAGEKMKSLGLIKEEYIESMLVRQDKLSVYIGNFVALPHGEVQDEFMMALIFQIMNKNKLRQSLFL
jgi:PTS system mannitol-specific IIA component